MKPSLDTVFYICVAATLVCHQLSFTDGALFFAAAAAATFVVEIASL